MGSLAAVFFDMDGLLVDTEPIWTIAENEAAARFGREFTPAMKRAMIGHGIDTAVPIMVSMLGQPESAIEETARFLLRRSAELFREPGVIVPRPGALELLGVLRAQGVPTALVSSSFRDLMEPVLEVVGRDAFAATVAGDEVTRRKPHPEPYLSAAGLLGVDPRHCAVLEDSVSGALAGVAAGCATVLVPSILDLPGSDLPGSDLPGAEGTGGAGARGDASPPGVAAVVDSLHEVSPALLEALLAARPARA
ncbi:HAD family hydrolase [Frankia sp. AgKG'84/4]